MCAYPLMSSHDDRICGTTFQLVALDALVHVSNRLGDGRYSRDFDLESHHDCEFRLACPSRRSVVVAPIFALAAEFICGLSLRQHTVSGLSPYVVHLARTRAHAALAAVVGAECRTF